MYTECGGLRQLALVIMLPLVMASPVEAAPLSAPVKGVFTGVIPGLAVAVGDPIGGEVTFDGTLLSDPVYVDQSSGLGEIPLDGTTGLPASLTVTIGSPPTLTLNETDDADFGGGFPSLLIAGFKPFALDFVVEDLTALGYADPLQFDMFGPFFTFSDPASQIIVAEGTYVTPAPAALWLAASAFGAMGLAHWRRRHRPAPNPATGDGTPPQAT